MAKRRTGRANGKGTLEIHGRTYRARYFKADPHSPTGFSRVTEGTGIRADGSDAEDLNEDGTPNPKRARTRAEQWLEDHAAPYLRSVEGGKLEQDAAALAGTLKKALARVNGEIADNERDRAEAEDKLPAYTLEEAWTAFDGTLESRQRDPATHRNYGQWYHLFTAWATDNHPEATELRDITTATAREYAKHLLERVRGTTYNRHLNALALIWATLAARDPDGRPAHPDAKLGGNPFAYDKATKCGIPRIKLEKKERPHRRRDLTLEEITKLLTTATGELRVLVALGFYTGLRLGDCATLKVANFDRTLGLITNRSKKTDMETETALHPCLAAIIEEEVKVRKGYILPEVAELYTQEQYAKRLKSEAGSELTAEELKRKVRARQTTGRVEITHRVAELFQSCGIETSFREHEDERARPEAGFHSLRHSFDTQLERARIALADRQKLMGHASAAMTEYYTHASTSAALALPDLLHGETSGNGATSPSTATEATTDATRYASACAIVDGLQEEDLRRLANYIETKLKKEVAK